jgi:hypothetical protein
MLELFLSERLQPCAGNQGPRGEPHAQSHFNRAGE